ncbi:hypothetical protein CRENBAI_009508 [Crenichthys baileyi]|uniref:Uncharacterized protein n=1 Tax=Crenichthys baileyi TaxID=28760 RepID=A0AAV9RS73_9TELE
MATSWLIGMLILDARLKKNALRKQLTLDAHSETPPDLTDRDAGLSEALWDYAGKTLEVKNVLFAYNIVTQWKYKVPVKSENWDYKLIEETVGDISQMAWTLKNLTSFTEATPPFWIQITPFRVGKTFLRLNVESGTTAEV